MSSKIELIRCAEDESGVFSIEVSFPARLDGKPGPVIVTFRVAMSPPKFLPPHDALAFGRFWGPDSPPRDYSDLDSYPTPGNLALFVAVIVGSPFIYPYLQMKAWSKTRAEARVGYWLKARETFEAIRGQLNPVAEATLESALKLAYIEESHRGDYDRIGIRLNEAMTKERRSLVERGLPLPDYLKARDLHPRDPKGK